MTATQEKALLRDIHNIATSLKKIASSLEVTVLEPAIGFAVETNEKEMDKAEEL